MNKIIKFLIILLSFSLICTGCTKEEENLSLNQEVNSLYERNTNVLSVPYVGINLEGLKNVNYNANIDLGSLTFGEYDNGDIASIKNNDLKDKEYVGYEMIVKKGDNVNYPFWAIAYSDDIDLYHDAIENGLDSDFYNMLPFIACDAMSFGYTDDGDRFSLYVSSITRYEPVNDNNVACSGTYPDALYKCLGKSLPSLVAANCITIDDALAFIGAVDEYGDKIIADNAPSLNVYSSSFDKDGIQYQELYSFALEDSSGRHGIVEFIDNKPIWHEGENYLFNYFIQDNYLLNEDETYKEKEGKGIGRMLAVSSYLANIENMEEHLKLMDKIECSNIMDSTSTVDWRSEFTGFDVFKNYEYISKESFDISAADEAYPLYAHYYDSESELVVLVDSYEKWSQNKDHLISAYDMNYCLSDEHKDEINNLINWFNEFYKDLSNDEIAYIDTFYKTYIKVIADPMNYRVTRWFNEEVSTADTIVFDDICDYSFQKEE